MHDDGSYNENRVRETDTREVDQKLDNITTAQLADKHIRTWYEFTFSAEWEHIYTAVNL